MTGEAAVIGLVVGLVVAALVVLAVHRARRRRPDSSPEPERHDVGQGGQGIPADIGQSRPAGPGAESQAPDAPGGVGAPDEGAMPPAQRLPAPESRRRAGEDGGS